MTDSHIDDMLMIDSHFDLVRYEVVYYYVSDLIVAPQQATTE